MGKSEGERTEQSRGVSFESKDIAARDGEKLFTNVEGAKQRERQAEKQTEAKVKEALKAQKVEKSSKKPSIFGVILIVIILAAASIVAFLLTKKEPEVTQQSALEYSEQIYNEAMEKFAASPSGHDYFGGEEVIANAILETEDDEKIAYLNFQRAKFHYSTRANGNKALEYLEEATSYYEGIKNECCYKDLLINIYSLKGEMEKIVEVQNEKESVSCE